MLGFAQTRDWVYPQSIQGRFMTLRRWTFAALHVVLFVAPWVSVGGSPLLRVDIPARRVFLLGQMFTPYDSIFLMLFLFFAAFALFFFTAIFGRVWCGYACPQTVFLETWIRPIELWIEGDRHSRMRRDGKGFTFDLAWRKALKWLLFAVVSVMLGMALVSLFAGARELWTGQAGRISYTFVAIVSAAWFWDFTWFREQFCNYLCPYARFQSALADAESLTITYEADRGEPREKGKVAAAEGRCIDCNKCVAVCPQGIDIRDGFQLECIQCARCIDACTSVMEPLGHPTLVSYGSIAQSAGEKWRLLRPRTVIYGGLLASIIAAGGVLAATRIPFEATMNRTQGTLFTVDADGFVRNTYMLEVTNNENVDEPVEFELRIEGLEDAEVIVGPIRVSAAESRTFPVVVRIPNGQVLDRAIPIEVHLDSPRDALSVHTTFMTGGGDGGNQ